MADMLVVEDEADLRRWLASELEESGYRVQTAADGVEATMRVLDGGVEAVPMDVRMPKLNGVDALRILRRLEPALPVIMFTGQAGQGDMLETTRLGALTCLLKPLRLDRLLDVLARARVQPEAS